MAMKWKGILFALDGVLCSTDRYHDQAWEAVAESLGIPYGPEIGRRLRGASRRESLEILLEGCPEPLSESEKGVLADTKNERYKVLLQGMTPEDIAPQGRAVLDELRRRGLLLAVASSSRNAPLILRRIGLEDSFDAVSDGNNVSSPKPAPEVYLCAAEMLGLTPASCLAVEGTLWGVQAAHSAGMAVACVGAAAEAQAGEYNLPSLGELLTILE